MKPEHFSTKHPDNTRNADNQVNTQSNPERQPIVLHEFELTRIIDEGNNVGTFFFSVPEEFNWLPGAHIHVAIPGFNANGQRNRDLVRHMSICTLTDEQNEQDEQTIPQLAFTTRLNSSESEFKKYLRSMEIGDPLVFFKCHATIPLRRKERPVVLLSQGVGIAAIRPLVLDYVRNQTGVPELTNLTVDRADQGVFESELSALTAPKYSYQRAKTRIGFRDLACELFHKPDAEYVIIGSDNFMADAVKLGLENGVDLERLILDLPPRKREEFLQNLATN